MFKIPLLIAVIGAIVASPALADGKSSRLGINWTSQRQVHVVPRVSQTVIIQIGDNNQAISAPSRERRQGARASQLGINGSSSGNCGNGYSNYACVDY
jgi:hypothetical protein